MLTVEDALLFHGLEVNDMIAYIDAKYFSCRFDEAFSYHLCALLQSCFTALNFFDCRTELNASARVVKVSSHVSLLIPEERMLFLIRFLTIMSANKLIRSLSKCDSLPTLRVKLVLACFHHFLACLNFYQNLIKLYKP